MCQTTRVYLFYFLLTSVVYCVKRSINRIERIERMKEGQLSIEAHTWRLVITSNPTIECSQRFCTRWPTHVDSPYVLYITRINTLNTLKEWNKDDLVMKPIHKTCCYTNWFPHNSMFTAFLFSVMLRPTHIDGPCSTRRINTHAHVVLTAGMARRGCLERFPLRPDNALLPRAARDYTAIV
jgi:hypothetical protein